MYLSSEQETFRDPTELVYILVLRDFGKLYGIMKTEKQMQKLASELALARYDAVRWVEESVKSGIPMARALESASKRAWGSRLYSIPSLQRWYYAYRAGGLKSLEIHDRADKGENRAMSMEMCDALISLRKEHPALKITTLVRQLEATGVIAPDSVSISSIYRHLQKVGLDPRTLKASGATMLGVPTKSFECAYANQLWMTDSMHGVKIARAGQRAIKTYLLAIIDDCSRLVTHAQYYPAEKLEYFLDTLKHALLSRGIPDKLYTDNGKTFTSPHLQTICANLGIQLIHHKPYQAWSKGKIERFFLTVQSNFEQSLVFDPVSSIEDLNERFWRWLEVEYHRNVHGALDGQTPAERFAQRSENLRIIEETMDIDALFLARTKRRVRRDATISLDSHVFEVLVALRGREVDVHYDPFGFRRVEIYLAGQFMGNATICDKELNSRTFEKENYENLE